MRKNDVFYTVRKCLIIASIFVTILSLLALTSTDVSATEYGGCAYPNGVEDFMAGAVPPPGTYFLNYISYYSAGDFKDSNGDSIPNFDLTVTGNTFRFVHITDKKVFGGFWGVHALLPILHVDIENPAGSDHKTGFGDLIVNPFILSWHFKNWHFATGFDIFIPIGNYDKDDLANTSRNYWTFEPAIGVTYLSDNGFEVSGKFMYDFNTENPDTDYKSGQEFHFDYTVGKHFKDIAIGIGGFYYKQVTSDEINGEKVGDGMKGQAFAIGPQLKYDYKNMSFTLKYHEELGVENRAEGGTFWFRFVYAF
jgi:hypothetical protein